MSSSLSPFDIAFNHASGFKSFQVAGFANAISTANYSMLGPSLGPVSTTTGGSADSIHLLDTSDTLTVAAASAEDTGTVVVVYLDQEWKERVAVYTMDAQTKTLDVQGNAHTARRVNQARYVPGGNADDIDLRAGNDLIGRIGAGEGLARTCLYTLPKGQIVCLAGFLFTAQANKAVELRLCAKVPGAEPYLLDRFPARETVGIVALPVPRRLSDLDFSDPANVVPIDAGLDLFFDAQREVGAMDTAQASATMSFVAQQTGGDASAPGFTSTQVP